jgi:phage/plasmid-associated DNA primase
VTIPKEERDPDLPEKLKAEWPAILRWMVNGCTEWQKGGLQPPKAVIDATNLYLDDEDSIGGSRRGANEKARTRLSICSSRGKSGQN